jgi:hypothetical protein
MFSLCPLVFLSTWFTEPRWCVTPSFRGIDKTIKFGYIIYVSFSRSCKYWLKRFTEIMSEKIVNYVIYFDMNVRKRHYHISQKGSISYFSVQLELKIENEWKVILRYDCSHGYSHKDVYDIEGDKIKTTLELNFENALTLSDWDINENWSKYKKEYLKE